MYELVEVRKKDVFTNSKVIAEGTNNQHHAVQQLISKYEDDIKDFGVLSFEMRVLKHENYRGSTREKVYFLNEEQAIFVITLLRNSKAVVKFKKELVRQFYAMRKFLIEKQSQLWNDTRLTNKENRLKETEMIKQLAEYAKEQGSTHSDKLYVVYTKLANSIVGDKRNNMTASELNNLTLVENIIKQTIEIDIAMGKHYKDIYMDCRERIEQFAKITYITT